MEQILVKAAQFFVSISILVIIHEFGHYLFARLFKTRVEKFYLFFDPWFSVFKKKVGDTEYGIGWLPLGGYVKISGMIDESMDLEAMKAEPQPWEFRSKKSWQRLLIMVGGVLMNILMAFIIYIGIVYTWGVQYLPNDSLTHGIMVSDIGEQVGFRNGDKIISLDGEKYEKFNYILHDIIIDRKKNVQVLRDGEMTEVTLSDEDLALMINARGIFEPRMFFSVTIGKLVKDSPAEQAGLMKGDSLMSVDDSTFAFYDEFSTYLKSKKNNTVSVKVKRGNEILSLDANVDSLGKIGFLPQLTEKSLRYLEYTTINYSFAKSIPIGIAQGIDMLGNYLKQLKLIFNPETKAYKSLGGFLSIGNIFPGVWDWHSFWTMTALLSVVLGVMNLLPIPALDGGHVMFLLFEMITGRKPSDKFLEYAQITGLVLVLTLLIYANGNDIVRFFFK